MCGRFSLGVDTDHLISELGLDVATSEHGPRYNIAPTQPVLAVVRDGKELRLGSLRWGLVPRWFDAVSGPPLINARSETVERKPAFRDAFLRRRCWILADGFYEWRSDDGGNRVPVHFRLPDGRPFAFAGLWDRWGDGADAITSGTILTTSPSEDVRPIHDRMPVILPADVRQDWLDPEASPQALKALLRPYPGPLEARVVSTRVNSPANDDPACVEPVEDRG